MKLHISREDFVENVNSASRQHHTLSPATLARFENGLGNPNAPIIPYIAAVLSCTVDDLFRRGN